MVGGVSSAVVVGASRESMMNPTRRVAGSMAVRVVWRQFHRRQVMPVSSTQIGSPGSGCSITGSPWLVVWNGSSPDAMCSRAGPS